MASPRMLEPTCPIDEEKRLASLRRLHVLDTPPEHRFDALTAAAVEAFGVPIALVSLVDSDRQWFKASVGVHVVSSPRRISFCAHAILGDDVLVVEDATKDPRFEGNPLVDGAPAIRFYAGQPLCGLDGAKLGTLCIIDTKPRGFSQAERNALRALASRVEDELSLGVTLGGYRLLEVKGRGGMGVVYKAEDLQLGRFAAVKVILREYARNPLFVQRFRREARALACVSHPNVVTVYAVGQEFDVLFLALEYLEGGSLDARIARARLPFSDAARAGGELARALAVIHEAGLVHRDVKPANVLFGRHGNLKLADFGLARAPLGTKGQAVAVAQKILAQVVVDGSDEGATAVGPIIVGSGATPIDASPANAPSPDNVLTEPGRIMGTPAYMAPEQAFNDEVDFRADLYSLGATVYAMLTGRPPFERSGIALIQQLVREAPRPPSQLAEGIPASLDKLVLRLLSKDPKDRGANASEIAEIFEGIARLRYRARLPEEPRRTGRRFASSDDRPSLPEDRPALPGQTPPPGSPGA